MRDDSKTKANNVKTKAAKPNKLQTLRQEAQEEGKQKLKEKKETRKEQNESFKEQVRQADIESGNLVESDESEWDNAADSKEAREAERLERRMKRMAKKGHS